MFTKVIAYGLAALTGVVVAQNNATLPTPYPTLSPTTKVPTQAPTYALNLCNNFSDSENFDRWSSDFDDDMKTCAYFCAIDVATTSATIVSCVSNCFSDKSAEKPDLYFDPFSKWCGRCFGYYADCIVNACECVSGRTANSKCEECSANTCEPAFKTCTGGFVVPKIVKEPELDKGLATAIAAGTGSLLLIFLSAGVFVLYRRSSRSVDLVTISESRIPEPKQKKKSPASPVASSRSAVPQVNFASKPGFGASQPFNPVTATGASTFRVAFPFIGQDETELTCMVGTILIGIEKVDESWYLCENQANGKRGYIPIANLSQL